MIDDDQLKRDNDASQQEAFQLQVEETVAAQNPNHLNGKKLALVFVYVYSSVIVDLVVLNAFYNRGFLVSVLLVTLDQTIVRFLYETETLKKTWNLTHYSRIGIYRSTEHYISIQRAGRCHMGSNCLYDPKFHDCRAL